MNVNEYGQVSFTTGEVLEGLYTNNILVDNIDDPGETAKHNSNSEQFGVKKINHTQTPTLPVSEYHHIKSNSWQMPEQYANINVEKYCVGKLESYGLVNENYLETLWKELEEYKNRDMLSLLKFLIYMIDTCSNNNIVTGVGRGSSVSSLVLYLIGVHYIDPVKYNLNYKEFLR